MKSEIQNPKSKIVVVGAGPAGTSLAIRLAKKDFKVTLIEREKFPRHKLCGEFISPECLGHFQDLDVLDEMLTGGGDRISETIFYSDNGRNVSVPSEWFGRNFDGALGLSRAEMDFRLMEKAKEAGVEVFEETQAVGLLSEDKKVCGVKVRDSNGEIREIFSDLTIDATGRAGILLRLAERENGKTGKRENGSSRFQISGFRFQAAKILNFKKEKGIENKKRRTKDERQRTKLVGFKVHLKNVHLPKGRCEIYFFRGGYGGLSYVEDGIANHCFLIKADVVKEFGGDADRILKEVIFQNSRARETLKKAEKTFDWLAVSVDGFGVKNLNPAKNLLTVGDSAAFIDPFTGSGMLMALESAEILAEVISENSRSFEKIAENYKRRHRVKFRNRLRICSFMRRLSFVPSFAKTAIFVLSLSRKSREILARSTRQTETKKVSKA